MRRLFVATWLRGLAGLAAAGCASGDVVSPSLSESEGGPEDSIEAGPAPRVVTQYGSGSCTPLTCAKLGYTCGPAGDGCGGLLDCGACKPPQSCGGGTAPSVCGGDAGCVPQTCASQGIQCGPAGDGCGGMLQCGACPAPALCGAGGFGICGLLPDAAACVPRTCAQQGITCGPAGDGCGNVLACGSCTAPETCGGGGTPGKCGGNRHCAPKTCADLAVDCGYAGDGCGGRLDCGTCKAPAICGASQPGVCGEGHVPTDAGVYVTCEGGQATTISGTVVAGTDPAKGFGAPDPVYNAYVYIPSGPLQPITTGATCDQCATPQHSLASAVTGVDGTFTLTNPPVGPNVPLVIQLGKWRRAINVNVAPCQNNALTTAETRLPRNQAEGNIPRFAIDTGNADVLECVLRKMGIDDAEFTDPNLVGGIPQSAGRVHFYQASPNGVPDPNVDISVGGAVISANTPAEDQLWGSQATMSSYDLVLFPCEGGPNNLTNAAKQTLTTYANLGGRVFATHYSYVWLFNDAPFSSTATWATFPRATARPARSSATASRTTPCCQRSTTWGTCAISPRRRRRRRPGSPITSTARPTS